MSVCQSVRSGGKIGISFDLTEMTVYCVFSLESPHRGNSDEHKQYTLFSMNKEKHPKLSQVYSYGIFPNGLKNEFETAVVNEPSVFKPLKFYSSLI